MAGLALALSAHASNLVTTVNTSQIYAVIDQWRVQYGRFINYTSTCTRSHPDLSPSEKRRRTASNWLSTPDASLQLIYRRSLATGVYEAVVVVSVRSHVVEEHYISKMNFSWPQVSCVSGFPARGSKCVIVSYKDDVGQIQKFALRFRTVEETEKFMNLVKEVLENVISVPLLQGPELNSEFSSQAEVISSDGPTTRRIELDWQGKTPLDNSNQLMYPSPEPYVVPNLVSQEGIGDCEVVEETSLFPPSFAQLVKNCQPAVSKAKPTECGDDLKSQFMQYLRGTTFTELLATVENVVDILDGDLVL